MSEKVKSSSNIHSLRRVGTPYFFRHLFKQAAGLLVFFVFFLTRKPIYNSHFHLKKQLLDFELPSLDKESFLKLGLLLNVVIRS